MMDENDERWDSRLDERGLDGIVWQGGAEWGEEHSRTITIIFKETDQNGKRLETKQQLIPNAEGTEYSIVQAPPELEARGIQEISVAVTQQPTRSHIFIKFFDLPEPIEIIKHY